MSATRDVGQTERERRKLPAASHAWERILRTAGLPTQTRHTCEYSRANAGKAQQPFSPHDSQMPLPSRAFPCHRIGRQESKVFRARWRDRKPERTKPQSQTGRLTTTNPSDVQRWEQFPFHLYRDCKQCHLWPGDLRRAGCPLERAIGTGFKWLAFVILECPAGAGG